MARPPRSRPSEQPGRRRKRRSWRSRHMAAPWRGLRPPESASAAPCSTRPASLAAAAAHRDRPSTPLRQHPHRTSWGPLARRHPPASRSWRLRAPRRRPAACASPRWPSRAAARWLAAAWRGLCLPLPWALEKECEGHRHAPPACWKPRNRRLRPGLVSRARCSAAKSQGNQPHEARAASHGTCNMLRHSTVSSTSRLVPLLSPAAAAESATDARSEKKICTWCGGAVRRSKVPRATTATGAAPRHAIVAAVFEGVEVDVGAKGKEAYHQAVDELCGRAGGLEEDGQARDRQLRSGNRCAALVRTGARRQ
eukprot:scaffold50939_cov58-Phaeocystis_antarctica.AAC.7